MYVCMYVCVFFFAKIVTADTRDFAAVFICMYDTVYVSVCICMYVCVCVWCMLVSVYVCMYVCM